MTPNDELRWHLPRAPRGREAELYALRMVTHAHGLLNDVRLEVMQRLFSDKDCIDEDALDMLRREHMIDARSSTKIALEELEQWQQLTLTKSDRLTRGLRALRAQLGLTPTEIRLLRLLVLATHNRFLSQCLDAIADWPPRQRHRALGRALNLPARKITDALGDTGTLVLLGLLDPVAITTAGINTTLDRIFTAIAEPHFSAESLLAHLIRQAPPATLSAAHFDHLPIGFDVLERFLAAALAQRRCGAHVLLWGAPGTGKTELSRALSTAIGAQLFEVPTESEDGDARDGRSRAGQFALCQRALSNNAGALLCFDKAEDLFPNQRYAWFFQSREGLTKGWINRLLESCTVPTLWCANSVEQLDPAFLRRFSLVVEVRTPPQSRRLELIERALIAVPVSGDWRRQWSLDATLMPAEIARVADVAALIKRDAAADNEHILNQVIDANHRACGQAPRVRHSPTGAHYRREWINTSADLNAITARLIQRPVARICLYGPSGTGKTAFAHYLAEEIGMPIMVRRASDLLGKYVGESEKLIAQAFRDATLENALLLIDEADSFLRDRIEARNLWEVTLTNELLTQIENFDGLLVITTNLFDELDPAVLRRFDLKLHFGYLTLEQRCAVFRSFASQLDQNSEATDDGCLRQRLADMDNLTIGDFSVIKHQASLNGAGGQADLVGYLAEESQRKKKSNSRPIGF